MSIQDELSKASAALHEATAAITAARRALREAHKLSTVVERQMNPPVSRAGRYRDSVETVRRLGFVMRIGAQPIVTMEPEDREWFLDQTAGFGYNPTIRNLIRMEELAAKLESQEPPKPLPPYIPE